MTDAYSPNLSEDRSFNELICMHHLHNIPYGGVFMLSASLQRKTDMKQKIVWLLHVCESSVQFNTKVPTYMYTIQLQ